MGSLRHRCPTADRAASTHPAHTTEGATNVTKTWVPIAIAPSLRRVCGCGTHQEVILCCLSLRIVRCFVLLQPHRPLFCAAAAAPNTKLPPDSCMRWPSCKVSHKVCLPSTVPHCASSSIMWHRVARLALLGMSWCRHARPIVVVVHRSRSPSTVCSGTHTRAPVRSAMVLYTTPLIGGSAVNGCINLASYQFATAFRRHSSRARGISSLCPSL